MEEGKKNSAELNSNWSINVYHISKTYIVCIKHTYICMHMYAHMYIYRYNVYTCVCCLPLSDDGAKKQ